MLNFKMPKGSNNMENKNEEQFILMKEEIENNKQEYKYEMKDMKETLTTLMMDQTNKLTIFMKDHTNISKSSPAQKDTTTPPDPTTTVQTNRRAPPLEGGHSENIGGMWNLKHEISSPIFYELLIKIELKGDTALDLKNFYNHVKMSLNALTKLREQLLTDFLDIK